MNERAKNSARYALVVAEFYVDIADALQRDATRALVDAGVAEENIFCARVPGAFEIPFACKKIMQNKKIKKCDAIIALGAVVRGETPHFDFVAAECARGVMQLNLAGDVPVIFGVLTTDNLAQARARVAAGRGGDFARAAMAVTAAGAK